MRDQLKAFALACVGGACFGALDAALVMQGGLWLVLGNVAAAWLTVGLLAGLLSRRPMLSAALGALAECAAVLAFYGVKSVFEGVPVALAAVWSVLALVSGSVMGWLSRRLPRRGLRWGLLALGVAWLVEPGGWSVLRLVRGGAMALSRTEVSVWLAEAVVGVCLIVASALTSRECHRPELSTDAL